MVVVEGLGHGLDAGEGADDDVGGLGGHDVGEEFALGLGFFEEFDADGAPVEEGAAAVESLGLLVEGEADSCADHGVGLEAVGVEEDGVGELLHFAGAVGDGQALVLFVQDAVGEVFFGGEVEVEGSFGDAGGGEDFADGCGLVAVFFEDLGCCQQDRLSGADRPVLLHHVGPPEVDEPGDP